MEAVKPLLTMILIGIRDWIVSNWDALIVEAIGIAITIGLIEALLRWRERRRWAPTRREVAAEVGYLFWPVFKVIAEICGLTWGEAIIPSPSEEELKKMMADRTYDFDRYNQRHVARFFEGQYPRDFDARHEKALLHASGDELKTLSETIGDALTNLDPSIDLAKSLFGPDVTAALLQAKERALWAQDCLYDESAEGAGPEERGTMRYVLELTDRMARALIVLWDNVE